MLETIKSYLVSLGFEVDKNTYNQATKAIEGAGQSIAKFAGSAVSRFAIAGIAVETFVATAVVKMAHFVSTLGEAQIENEKLARSMWMSEDSAMAFNSSLKALHANLHDLYLSPTLAGQFQELMKEANALRPPDEFKNQMKLIQSITFEFKRLKLEATYALQWIGYYFVKYMGGPLLQIKKTLAEINNTIIKTMPHWTKVVAEVMSWFARMGIATVRAMKDVGHVFDEIGKSIPRNIKLIGGAIAGLAAIIEMGPIGIITALIVGAILLLDDFYTYLDGGDSAFGPFWKKVTDAFKSVENVLNGAKEKLTDFFQALQDNTVLDDFKQGWSNLLDIISSVGDTALGWIKEMYDALQNQGAFTDLYNNINNIVSAVSDLFSAVTDAVKKFLELDGVKTILKDIGGILTETVIAAFKEINTILKSITDGIDAISKFMKGDMKGALKSAGRMIGDFINGNAQMLHVDGNYMYPASYNTNNQRTNVSVAPTYNIYGTDPRTTLDATHDYTQVALVRTMRGVFS